MIHLFINGLAASAGGGLTYLRNVIPQLEARDEVRATVLLTPWFRSEFGNRSNVDFVEAGPPSHAGLRFGWEQSRLPAMVRRSGADVLLSAGNFALRRSPIPQILLSRNSLYSSRHFWRDLRRRGEYALWLDTRLKAWLAKRSVAWANSTVAPSVAFAGELQRWSGRQVTPIYHGFDGQAFSRDSTPLGDETARALEAARGCLRLLFVSHYNYYRNFETLLRALPLISRPVKLFLTCRLREHDNPGRYHPGKAAGLVRSLGLDDMVVELGAIAYQSLHHVYRACDIYVSPAYSESFAHPLVEAMSQGVPIAASGLEVHREICGDAAVYFDPFSPKQLAAAVGGVAGSPQLAARLGEQGRQRSRDFSWQRHVSELIALAARLTGKKLEMQIQAA